LVPDKLVHAATYFLLMVWFSGVYERKRHFWLALALVALGFALDLLQKNVSTRSFDMMDVLANGAGILVGFALARFALAGWCQRVERVLFA
jgi:VanZ family protein